MKISEALSFGRNALEKVGVSNSKLDSLVLLSYAISFSKEKIIFNPDIILEEQQQEVFINFIKRRSLYEPVSHIIGKREFYARDFIVSKDVLDPRPDSESLIELVLKNFSDKNKKLNILEIGCGSGCLIITLLKELKNAQGIAIDISKEALEISRKNAKLHEVSDRINFIFLDIMSQSSWNLEIEAFSQKQICNSSIKEKFDLIISNPPYIESAEIDKLQPEVRIFEPKIALDGGLDGLDFYRRIAAESKIFLNENGKVIVEIGFGQSGRIKKIFLDNGFKFIESKFDLGGVERVLNFAVD
jgi:release factor glutamine methyltransferase